MSSQLDLFEPAAGDGAPGGRPDSDRGELVHAEAASLAARIPSLVRFGTSSWSFPGWRGLVYPKSTPASALSRDSLKHYARHPLLRTVGIDRSYYAPIPADDLRHYAGLLPPGFLACAKAPASVMSAADAAGERNPDFLSSSRLIDELIEPFDRSFRSFTGPFVLECPPVPRAARVSAQEFEERLDCLLAELPRDFQYAVELRDRDLLTDAYARVLTRHGAAHVYNYWSAMPMPGAQMRLLAPESFPFTVIRLLLRPGTRYEDQREQFRPFDRIQAEDPAMRADVIGLVERTLAVRRPTFVLVNNKAEGSSPLTVMGLARLLAGLTP